MPSGQSRPSCFRDGGIVRYGFAFLMVALAAIIRIVLTPIIPTGFPFLTFFLAVMLAAWRGGLGPGVFASVLSTLAADLLFIEPLYEFHLAAGYYWVSFSVFVLEAVGITMMMERMKRIQGTLHESESRFRLIADAAPVLIWMAGLDKRCTYFNQGWLDFTGRTLEQESGDGWAEGVHPDDQERCLRAYTDAFNRHEPFVLEYRLRRADGQYGWIVDQGVPLWGNDRVFRGYIGACVDITGQKQTEEALRLSEERLNRVLETDAVGVIFFDHDGLVINANDVFLRQTGYRREQIDRRELHWRKMTPPEWIEVSENQMAQFAQTGRIGPYEKEYLLAGGTRRWMLFAGRDLGDGTIAEYCIDIHDRKEAQLRLEHFSEELERQVTTRTAELLESQERLRALASELNLAEQRERKRLATELHDHLQQILVVGKLTIGQGKRSVSGMPTAETVLDRLDEMLSDALTYSRTLVAELSPPVLREHGLAASLHWLAEYMKRKHEHTVTVFAPDDQDLALPEDQRILLFQSARELLINSAKHAGIGQAIVTMEKRMDQLCITVKDEGKGFDFPLAAAAGASTSAISSKFGLYSIQERMRALGGSFEVQSAPDKGTSAILRVPLPGSMDKALTPRCDVPISSRRSKADIVPHDASTICVLLVDDHVMIRQGLRTMLEAQVNVKIVGEAANGEEAIALAHTIQADVILMDINMPKLNGIEATAVIKQHFPHMAIVGLSVNADRGSREAMIQAGAATLLTKEAPVEELYHAIQLAVKARTYSDSLVESSPSRKGS